MSRILNTWPALLTWAPVGLALAIFLVDLLTPLRGSESMLYVAPILLASRTGSLLPPLLLTAACTGLIALAVLLSPSGVASRTTLENRAMAVAVLWAVGLLMRERLAIEAMLRVSEERHRVFAEMTSDFVYVYRVEPDGRLVNEWTGESIQRVLGYTPDMLRTLPAAFDNAHADDRAQLDRVLARVLAGEAVDFEMRVIDAHGGVRWLRNWVRPRWNDGRTRVDRIFGAAQDLTERRRAEQALRESEGKFSLLFNQAPFAAVLTQMPEGTITDVNEAFERVFGYSRRDTAGLTSVELGILTPAVREQLAAAFQAQGTTRDFELTARTRSGDERLMLVNSDRIEIGGRPHILTVIQDITERQKAETDLQAMARRLLTAEDAERRRIAKELHDSTVQDLVAVMMTLDATRDEVTGAGVNPHPIDDAIAILEKSAHDIRTLSYLLHPPLLDESGLAGAIRDYVAGFRERTGLEVILTIADDLPRAPAHVELALFRVLQEALANMYRHAGSPTVKVSLASAAQGLRLEVQDYGRGMSRDVAASAEPSGHGLGVGIAAMRERLQQIGGRLEIESSERGTTVRAVVPGGRT